MTTTFHDADENILSTTALRAVLREVGYVLWLSRKLAAEIQAEQYQPVRPEMADFCAVDMAACAA